MIALESLEGRRLLASDIFAAAQGEHLRVVLDGSALVVSGDVSGELLRQSAATIEELRIVGSESDDTLQIDYSGGVIPVPIRFEGSGQASAQGDSLRINAGAVAAETVTHTFVNANDGSISVLIGSQMAMIAYTGLEPIVDNLNAVNRDFVFTGGGELITLSDDAIANNNLSMIDSTLGESVVFVNPTNSLTIRSGSGNDALNVSSLDAQFRASLILDGGVGASDSVSLTNVNLINTPGRGLNIREFEVVDVTGGQISGNTASIGGGVLIENSTVAPTTATLTGTTITNNSATAMASVTDGGGGFYSNAATLLIESSVISDNATAGSGGGIFSLGQLTIINSTLATNNANRAGGGIEIASGSSGTTLTNVMLRGNRANAGPGNGGGLHVTGNGNVEVVRGTIIDNVAAREGGGLWNDQGVMTINGTSFLRNIARGDAADDGGGAIFNNGGLLDLDNLDITDNEASGVLGSGGGLFSIAGMVTIDDSMFTSNSANRAGGGIEIVAGTVTISDTDLIANDVNSGGVAATVANPGNGGALHVTTITPGTTVTIRRAEVRGNVAAQEGGGLWNSSGAMMILDEVNINNNVVRSLSNGANDQGGGGVFNNGGRLVVQNNSLITDNRATENLGNGGGLMTVGGTVEISHTTILRNVAARAGGGIENNGGILTLTDAVGAPILVENNTASINGGGLHAIGATAITTVIGGTFRNNTAQQEGGGFWNQNGLMRINGTTITANIANSASNAANDQGGGGVFNINGTLDIDSATITNNQALLNNGNGGGVMTVGGTVTIDDSSIQNNRAARAGGGIENNNGVVTVTNQTVGGAMVAQGNTAGINGGGLHASGASSVSTVNGGVFQNNVAGQEGGGLWVQDGRLNINGTTITANTANSGANGANDQGGGGVFNINGTVDIDNATITNNVATTNNGNGGGVMTVGGTVTIDASTIANNDAARAGGGIENNNGTITLTDVVVGGPNAAAGNSAGINGGGLHASGAQSVSTVIRGSFQNNVAGQEGGGLWGQGGRLNVNGTTITANTANSGANGANDQGGGGVFNINGTLDIDNATITSNIATANAGNGGGVMIVGGTATIDNTFIGSNLVGRDGGGLHASAGSDVTVTGGTVRSHSAPQEGGGLWNGTGTLRVNGTLITDNRALAGANASNDQGGGGVFNNGGTLNVTNATITNNTATSNNGNGGGVMTVGGTVTLSGGVIQNNDAARAGGGIENNNAMLTMSNVVVGGPTPGDGNTAGVNGGGLHVTGAGRSEVTGGTFRHNSAGEEGGGLWNGTGIMNVTGTGILEDRANGSSANQAGGGVFNSSGVVTLRNIRLNNNIANSASGSGGGAFNDAGTLNVFDSEVSGNNRCGLAYLRPSGTLSNITVNAPNVGGLLCPLLGTSGDDTILVTNVMIMINADQLTYDGTVGPITIESRLGNDLINVRSTAAPNPITILSGPGTDTINISSDASGNPGSNVGNLNGVLGNINIVGDSSGPNGVGVRSAIASRAPGNDVALTTTVTLGDSLIISDRSSTANHSFNWTPTTFARTTTGASTGVITFTQIESIDVQTGSGNDTLNVTDTTPSAFVALRTNEGNDRVNFADTGNSGIVTVHTGIGSDRVDVTNTGDASIFELQTEAGADDVRLFGRGNNSGVVVRTGGDDDAVTIGGPTPATAYADTQSIVEIHGEAGRDSFVLNEVFLRTIIDLEGNDGNDLFTLNSAGSDATGNLQRLNNDPVPPLDDATASTRQLLIDGGANESTTREFVEGIDLSPTRQAIEPGVIAGTGVPLQTGDRIVVNAQSASTLDLRYVIDSLNQGVLATTPPAATQAARSQTGNEVFDSLNVETVEINAGNGNDILTVTSDIAYGIASSNQAIAFNAGPGTDRLEVLGTNLADRITIGAQDDATLEPIEVNNVEGIRVDGVDGDDKISNRSATLSVLDAQLGNDILLGGIVGDVLTGGDGVDNLLGRDGNDILFSERNFGSDEDFVTEGELVDGGNQTTARPGDVCLQLGLDLIKNCEVLGDGGGLKDVTTWLLSKIIPGDSISFENGDPQLDPFNEVSESPVPLSVITEPNVLAPGPLANPVVPPPQSPIPLPAPAPIVSSPANPVPGGEPIFDVDGDGNISAMDALRIINQINQFNALSTSGELVSSREYSSSRDRGDVNGDGFVTALDALMIINRLNAASVAGESVSTLSTSTPILPTSERNDAGSAVVVSAPVQRSVWPESVDEIFRKKNQDYLRGQR